MKKRSIRTGILFALLTPVLLICAENPIYAATTQTAGSATVSYHVDPAYQVTIPVDTSMQFNETETSYGNIVVEQAQIEDGKCIQVSLLSDLNLKNSNNSKAVIPYQILAQDGEYSQLVVNEYGKGHSVYFAGLPYSPQNCRILLRAIYYAAGMPEEMKHYYVTNVDTEVTVFPETKRIAVINNADAEEKTDLYIKGHLIDSLTLAPREMRWVDDAE